ncbi:WXG100 family type VII secretion target [Nocardioides sp. Soil805]|uniref:WXG100 family type VII secretion target n=1 Tax=Nocardioides sp. Soil805 TaxID=1736416 RepID=UPI000703515A|nr:WXG100 family type VII secretion target [Nocardioides sp. Soil805]KRF37676.1 hypothetical protein ASG94_10385 [Nocardioides sp. Soil805]
MSDNASKTEEWMSGFLDAIYSIMKPLLNPLVDKWDSVTGDAQAVYDTSGKWKGMAESMRAISQYEVDAADLTSDGWRGLSGESYRAAVAELADYMDQIAGQMDGVSGFLDQAAEEVHNAEQLCQQLVYELVEWAAISLAVSAAGAVFTFGASAAAGAAAAAAKAGVTGAKIANLLRKVAAALKKVAAAIKAYKAWLKTLSFKQKFLFKAAVEKPIVRAITQLDGDYKGPLYGLGNIKYNYGNDAPSFPGAPTVPSTG